MKRLANALVLVLAASSAAAQDNDQGLEPLPLPPVIPPPVESGAVMEPDVTIIEAEDKTIEEYRINGRLYLVKITPSSGPPYYLVDSNGDGEIDQLVGSGDPTNISIQQWILHSW